MSDDIENQVTEQLQAEGISVEEPRQLSDFEKEQESRGWNPEGTKSAEEWARAEPLYSELKHRGKEIKQLKRTLSELTEHMQKQKEAAYNQALRDLQQQRLDAIERGDVSLVNQIDQEADKLEQPVPIKSEAVRDFEERHAEWLHGFSYEDLEMQKFAFERDQQLASRKLDPEEHMKVLEEHIKKKFPSYFNEEPQQSRASSVESGSEYAVSSSKKRKYEFKDLNPEQKQIARDFDKLGVMKVADYIKQLVENGDLK